MKGTKDLKTNRGITLIALVITIIVMLILVAVTITMAVNGGLFEYAGRAATKTNGAVNAEQQLASGRIKIGNTWYDSIDDYVAKKPSTNQGEEEAEEPEKPTQTLILTGESEVDVKSTITLVAKLNDEEVTASNIQWTTSNPEVATVSEGVVTGVNSTKGTTTITATYNNSVIATKEITVNAKYLGDCTECTDGTVNGYVCSYYNCGAISETYEYTYVAYCNNCETPELIYDGVCYKCKGTRHVESGYEWVYVLPECMHYFSDLDLYGVVYGADCTYCTDGNLYDDGN